MLSFITVKGSISVLYFVLPFSTFRQKGNSKPHLTSPSTLFGIPLCMTLIIKNRHQRGASEFQSSHLLLLFFFFTSKVLSKFLSTIPIICQCSKGLSPLMMIVAETWEKTRCRSSAWHKLPVPYLIVKTISFKITDGSISICFYLHYNSIFFIQNCPLLVPNSIMNEW